MKSCKKPAYYKIRTKILEYFVTPDKSGFVLCKRLCFFNSSLVKFSFIKEDEKMSELSGRAHVESTCVISAQGRIFPAPPWK